MDNCVIQQVKFNNIVRNTRRTIEKLFLLHKNNKITDEEFKSKLDRLKELVIKSSDSLIEIEKEIEERKDTDPTLSLVVEHLNHIGCYSTASHLATKFQIPNDQAFFKMVEETVRALKCFNFQPAFDFSRENRSLLKNLAFETKLKVHRFIYFCAKEEQKEGLLYLTTELKKYPLLVKSLLPLLINKSLLQFSFESSHKNLVSEFHGAMLDSFKLSKVSRLTRRVEYGMMAFKTQECFKEPNRKCPTCCPHLKLREEVPFNRHEQSIILCRGSGEELDDQNQPYAFDNGHVYGNHFIKSKNNLVVCPKTGKSSSKYPRVCYFV